jgi:hypothetical protein
MKNGDYWDINAQVLYYRRHITSPLQSPAGYCYLRFEVFTAVTMKNGGYWGINAQVLYYRRHITSPLQSPAGYCYLRFEVLGL